MSAKRQRSCGSNGSFDCPTNGARGGDAVPLNEVIRLFEIKTTILTQDDEHKDYLACPFWKHDPNRYLHVKNSCTDGVGFKDIGKLTEHIKRVHCLWNGCERCRKRFNKYKITEADEVKRKHMETCEALKKELTDADAEWMNEAQDEKYRLLNFQKDKGDSDRCYKKICFALWGSIKNAIEGPYHLPGFQVSVLRWQFLEALKSLQAVEIHQQGAITPASALAVDPMLLSQQALHDLSSGPPPFYRGQHRKDSGVWSWDPSSENQPNYNKPTFDLAPDGDESEDDTPMLEGGNSNMDKAGTWTSSAENFGTGYGEFEKDADEDLFGGSP
ncbi:uncharacterized protein F4822DRAFT_427253 [Hypoxylon trugodes]|uniref:uncharacterized protein n=1 Tax=Hypoxylon trugodes TaxID=326681 RepID=UPI002197B0EC|nr:uncharacterized protein F4822DRAFT_427253 [Hypoxylon trugodes]KAI1391404.1 hypothetical protein F4822DRAFT_427253 [Hypoxylon trugodes]